MNKRRKRQLAYWSAFVAAQGGVEYLLRVEFATDDAAPVTSPYVGEVGSVTIIDSGSISSVSGSQWGYSVQNPSMGSIGMFGGALTRTAGYALVTKFNASTFPTFPELMAWNKQNADAVYTGQVNIAHGLYYESGTLRVVENADPAEDTRLFLSTATDYQLAIVLLSTGANYFIKGGAYTNWRLLWQAVSENTATLYPCFLPASISATATIQYDYMRVAALTQATFINASGVYNVNQSSPSSGANYTATADGIHDIAFTLDGSPITGDRVDLHYREQDANNYWTAYIGRSGGATWDCLLDSVSGGVATNRITVANVGTPTRLRVIVEGTKHNIYTYQAGVWTKRGGEINVSHMDTETSINATYSAGNTVSSLISMKFTDANYDVLDNI